MITAAQRAGKKAEIEASSHWPCNAKRVTLLARARDFTASLTREPAIMPALKRLRQQTDHTLRVMLNLLLMLIFLRQRLYLTGGARRIINRITAFVVGDRKVALRFGDI